MKMEMQWSKTKIYGTRTNLRGKFIATQAYLRKQERSNHLTLKEREIEEQTKLKVSRRKETIKIWAEINGD